MTDVINAALPVLTDWRLLAAAFATAIAGLMRGYAGFGTAVILAPIYSVLWGPKAGVPVTQVGTVTAEATLKIASGPSISVAELRSAHEGWFPAYMSGEL